ncbi:TIGR01777 family oxidoreductase [Vibrio rumoiensis]|uniref:TIGR01777 family protein n=1 Tax=Vibrio rumoiensis 1S-45 TaxID=1188252 RepID=A0A1E5E0I7_9VIBR|nr:TIGR01777 family oxidoreductase [Vibrio rumoiensis]OEF24001.1 TIGR01777 family protein [Vibrio rumoiensis 1S-45]
MHILLTGGTGFIGCELIKHLTGHQITVLTRSPKNAKEKLRHADFSNIDYIDTLSAFTDLNHIDAVINLAGEPIAHKRWSEAQKERICSSRWVVTQQLVDLIKQSATPPYCFISGSAVGIYGDKKYQHIYENSKTASQGFPYSVCNQWEEIAKQAASDKTKVCLLRTGIVLGPYGGALKAMLPPFKLGVGGKLGSGDQYMPWIHIQDAARAIAYLLFSSKAEGVFNLSAPHPVTNHDFSQTLAKCLKRPCLFSTPRWLLNLIMGESAELVFDSVRAKPKHLTEIGFIFTFSHLEPALKQVLNNEN